MQEKLTGREYLRVSKDASGEERSQDEQHDENVRQGRLHSITLGAPYREPGSRSASRYATKAREVYAGLIADLEADRFGADVLVLWEHSRGSRRVGEWVTLIDLCEERRVRVFVTTHGRIYDPANARDRRSLLEDAVDSEYESAKIRERAKRAQAASAAKGRPGGSAPYGYVRTYDPHTRKLIAQKPAKGEAPVVRDLFRRVRKGESFRSIAKVFEDKGIRRRSGSPFTPAHLRDLARRATYAGLRAHNDYTPVQGTWTALVKREVWNDVQTILDRPERKTTRPGRGVHLLSMIATCDPCGGPLAATNRGPEPQYQCHHKGCVRIRKDDLDGLVESAVVAFMADETNVTALAQPGADPDEIAKVRAELSEVTKELADLRTAGRARKLSVATVLAIEPGLVEQVADLEERERALTAPPEVVEFQKRGRNAAERWAGSDMAARRALLRLILAPGHLGEVRVTRRPVRSNQYVPAEQRVIWAAE
jgi:site-specific DNA recombinase